jgi:hypothetical protein
VHGKRKHGFEKWGWRDRVIAGSLGRLGRRWGHRVATLAWAAKEWMVREQRLSRAAGRGRLLPAHQRCAVCRRTCSAMAKEIGEQGRPATEGAVQAAAAGPWMTERLVRQPVAEAAPASSARMPARTATNPALDGRLLRCGRFSCSTGGRGQKPDQNRNPNTGLSHDRLSSG